MLELHELRELFERLGTPAAGRRLIEDARRLAPVRQVLSNSNNVITRFVSRKMGRMIDTESRTVEYPAVIQYEHDERVLEYYAQPMTLDLKWQGPEGQKASRTPHTPDFLLIRQDGFFVEEWREESRLLRLSTRYPGRFVRDEGGWRYPVAEAFLAERGIHYRLRSADEHPRVYIQNLIFLANYLDPGYPDVDPCREEAIAEQFRQKAAIPLLHLLQRGGAEASGQTFSADDVYKSIANGKVAFDLRNDLLSETHRVVVFRDPAALQMYRRLEEGVEQAPGREVASIEVGARVDWDGKSYLIQRVGQTSATLRSEDEVLDLELAILTRMHLDARLQIHAMVSKGWSPAEVVNSLPPRAIEEALERAKWLQLAETEPEKVPRSDRSLRRYRRTIATAGSTPLEQHLALASRVADRGNRLRKIPQRLLELIAQVAREQFNTPANISMRAAYRYFVAVCLQEDETPCSVKTFSKELESLRSVRAQKGKRLAYQAAPIVWYLKLTETVHGVRPFQYVHIDHTQLDLILISSETRKPLGKPWLTLAVDAESRDVAGFYLSFEAPSYRSCMMVLRDIVRRHKQLPEMLVLDNGKEFHSRALARVCELYGCSLRYRPGGQPRYGTVMERLFGVTNTQFIHLLKGNTKLLKNPRSLTKSVLPENFAEWSLPQLHGALDFQFNQIYGAAQHPAHGLSPAEYFKARMLETGERRNRLVRFDETFRIETCPSPSDRETRIVDGQRGVKVNHLWFWNDLLASPTFRKAEVEVRMDPWDPGTVFVLLQNQWVACRSKINPLLSGYTEVERRYLFDELRKKHGGSIQGLQPERIAEWLHVMNPKNFDRELFDRQAEGRRLYGAFGMTVARSDEEGDVGSLALGGESSPRQDQARGIQASLPAQTHSFSADVLGTGNNHLEIEPASPNHPNLPEDDEDGYPLF